MAKLISQRKLNSIKLEWQRKLRLQDWRIKIDFADAEFIKEEAGIEAIGACEAHAEPRRAQIWILQDTSELQEEQQDVEETVLHELLHCHFAAFRTADPMNQLQIEQIIEVISEALLTEKRGKKR